MMIDGNKWWQYVVGQPRNTKPIEGTSAWRVSHSGETPNFLIEIVIKVVCA